MGVAVGVGVSVERRRGLRISVGIIMSMRRGRRGVARLESEFPRSLRKGWWDELMRGNRKAADEASVAVRSKDDEPEASCV